jgi:hypothetical protein
MPTPPNCPLREEDADIINKQIASTRSQKIAERKGWKGYNP